MKARDIRNLNSADTASKVEDLRHDYFALQEAIRLGKDRNHARLKTLRRDIARHLSVLRESTK
jgi:ribosomal protein L29